MNRIFGNGCTTDLYLHLSGIVGIVPTIGSGRIFVWVVSQENTIQRVRKINECQRITGDPTLKGETPIHLF